MLDLDETLVHSSFKPIPDPDYIIPVEIEGKVRAAAVAAATAPRRRSRTLRIITSASSLQHSVDPFAAQPGSGAAGWSLGVVDGGAQVVDVYVLKRPHMDTFMASVGAAYEVVVFTASLAKYADPLLDLLDRGHVVPPRRSPHQNASCDPRSAPAPLAMCEIMLQQLCDLLLASCVMKRLECKRLC